jgi:hypothetical protein
VTYSEQRQDAELPSKIIDSTDTQFCGLCHDTKSEQVPFSKQEKDAVLLYYLSSKHTQSTNDQMNDPNHYKEEPLQKHCCTDSGIQSKLIFTSEKTNGHQQLTHSTNFEGGRLVSLLLSGHKFVGIQPTSLCLMNNSRQSRLFVDNVPIDLWQCRMEINKVKSKKTKSEPIASHSTIQSEPIVSCSPNQIKRDKSSATFKLVVAFVFNNVSIDSWQCRMEINNVKPQSIHSWQCQNDKVDLKLLSPCSTILGNADPILT